ncbi:hypothetical protein DXG01_017131 [Tephrocybe rancida]|nr:hypothetical protein DXG01_017131 [Tephrocybe rancida]
MSVATPSRIRSKTSDFTQFFRGQPSRHSSQHDPVESPALLAIPDAPESTTPKKSKLPFLGRTRKKSTHSAKSAVVPSTGRGYESEAAELPSSKTDRRLSHPVPSPEPTIRHPPLPTANVIPHISVSSPSLGSKFVAHFSNSKLRKTAPSPRRTSEAVSNDGNNTDTLSPPMDTRTTSFDSTTTTTTTSTIPQPSPRGTLIKISTHDELEEYRNLFTLPLSKKPVAPKRLTTTPASEYRDRYHKTESNVTLTPTPPSNPRADHLIPVVHDSPLPSSSRADNKERDARRLAEGTRPSKIAKKRAPGPRLAEDSTPEDSADESVLRLSPADLAPVIDITPPLPSAKPSSPIPRIRKRAPPAIKETRASTPPSIPLPAPPTNNSPTSATFPRSSPKLAAAPPPSALALRRPRANTVGSVPLTPLSAATITAGPSSPKRSPKLSGEKSHAVKQSSSLEISDLDMVTAKQLKEALVQRNQQYNELTTHFLEVTKDHAAEKAALEKRIAALDAEVARKDKEIQGFTWMLRGTQAPSDTEVDYTRIPGPRMQRSPSAASSKMSSRRIQQPDDSGAESFSGAESVRGSGASVSSMSSRLKKGLRPLTLAESSYSIYQSSILSKPTSSRGPAVDSGHSDNRTSVYSLSSLSSTTSSNSSSLLPPSPSVPISSLSAIPEVSAVTPSKIMLPRISTSPRRDSLSTSSEWETDIDKKPQDVVPSSRRISASSFSSSSSSAATSAYSANLKRGRPPSIAQVLQKSPTMGEVLGKLRPLAVAAPAAAYS